MIRRATSANVREILRIRRATARSGPCSSIRRSRGRGIGSALFDQVCRLLVGAGNKTLRLETMPGTRAEAFYHARGWTGETLNARGELVLHQHTD